VAKDGLLSLNALIDPAPLDLDIDDPMVKEFIEKNKTRVDRKYEKQFGHVRKKTIPISCA
jgi:hypothetical protein